MCARRNVTQLAAKVTRGIFLRSSAICTFFGVRILCLYLYWPPAVVWATVGTNAEMGESCALNARWKPNGLSIGCSSARIIPGSTLPIIIDDAVMEEKAGKHGSSATGPVQTELLWNVDRRLADFICWCAGNLPPSLMLLIKSDATSFGVSVPRASSSFNRHDAEVKPPLRRL